MHLAKSSYVERKINMSEGLVNIDLPWHKPECTYQQRTWMEVLELLQWWHGRIWLSMTPPVWCRPKRRRAPCQLMWIIKVRSYTRLVCRNHGPWWLDPLAQCFGIGGAKYVSFMCIWACANQGGVAKPWIVRGAFLFFCVRCGCWRRYAKLATDESCKALQARESKVGWSQVAKYFSAEVQCHSLKAGTQDSLWWV